MTDFFDEPPIYIPPQAEPDWDPTPAERSYYRSNADGQRGFLVRRGGKDMIRYDRPGEEILRPYHESLWKVDADVRPMSIGQAAEIAHVADQKLCYFLGEHKAAKLAWSAMKDEDRRLFIQKGPPGDARQAVYRAVLGALQPFVK